MAVTRRVTFRLYPSRQQTAILHYWRRLHCSLYNAAVYNRKTQYQKFGHSVDYFEQQNSLPAFKQVWPEYQPLGSHALQATLKRVDFAFQRFFKGLAKYPKFKSIRQYSGWTYPDTQSWKAITNGKNGYLELANLGKMQMRGQARTWGKPTTCTIVYRP
ncbi:RNA-guided endonuclease InsQ/TnpB family protein, partial [Thermoleptolyngbya sp.]